jgi:conjugal transfer/entry exclusion protein
MVHKRIPAITAMLFCITMPCITDAQFVVHDPLNGVQLAIQVQKSVTLIENDVKILQTAQQNLATNNNAWTNIQTRLVNLQQMINSTAANKNVSMTATNAQVAQLGTEISTITNLQHLAQNATGNMQAQGANTQMQSEVITQLEELRQLTLAEKMDEQAALQRFHTPAKDPSTY